MKIATEQLPQQLQRGLAPLYTVYGAEPLLALEAIDRIRARARADGYSERDAQALAFRIGPHKVAVS